MRRKDREITDLHQLTEILARCQAGTLAFGGQTPYAVPLSYGFALRGGVVTLYFHGALEGEKLRRIAQGGQGMFCAYRVMETVLRRTYATVLYESVCASGPVWIVEEETEKREALDLILRHYGGQLTADFGSPARTAVFALRCDTLTGKRNP
jgi:nitroimidazol reductase NimA-like FMN-containing flavoprotein (pyridoxamine 5'-phosphate oxidase superfamily)